jgi:hypothetical protein
MDPIIYRESLQTEQYDSMSLNGEYSDLHERCTISFCCLLLNMLHANTVTVVDIVNRLEFYQSQGLRTYFSVFSSRHDCMNRALET